MEGKPILQQDLKPALRGAAEGNLLAGMNLQQRLGAAEWKDLGWTNGHEHYSQRSRFKRAAEAS